MAWQRTTREDFACSPSALWAVVGDPQRWPQWCDAVGHVAVSEPVFGEAQPEEEPAPESEPLLMWLAPTEPPKK